MTPDINPIREIENKRVVLAFGLDGKEKIDPSFCDHKSTTLTYEEIDGKLWVCQKCGASLTWTDDDGWIVELNDRDLEF